jgi:hypothetical protein
VVIYRQSQAISRKDLLLADPVDHSPDNTLDFGVTPKIGITNVERRQCFVEKGPCPENLFG